MPILIRPGIALTVAFASMGGIEGATVPGYTATIGDGSYFLADKDELRKVISSWGKAPANSAAPAPAK